MLYELFLRTLNAEYKSTDEGIDYSAERDGDTLYIFFECSDGKSDWWLNFDFPAKPYKNMSGSPWYAHGGFVRAFRSVEPYLREHIFDYNLKRIVTSGYSHGAAVGVLCHEYIWFNRPDLRAAAVGYGFGSPRVIWGLPNAEKAARWERFTVVRNIDDLVTHLPPAVFGYFHVGKMLEIGKRGKYSPVDAHRPENILKELYEYENSENREDS